MNDQIVIENPLLLLSQWRNPVVEPLPIVQPPAGTTNGVPPDVYDAYRRGRDSACVDIMLATRLKDGTPAVLLSKRKVNVCFGGMWWMYGGAVGSYQSMTDFVVERAKKECGIRPDPSELVLVGVYRTCAPDIIGSTLQPCYAARVGLAEIQKYMGTDQAHESIKLFTLRELYQIPTAEQHWYPMRVASLVLQAL